MVNLSRNKKLFLRISILGLVFIIAGLSFFYFQKRSTENRLIGQLQGASARQVLDNYFWGINNNSARVVKAYSYNKNYNFDYAYSDVASWIPSDMQEVAPDKSYYPGKDKHIQSIKNFKVKFEMKKKFFVTDPSMDSGVYTWTYILVKENESSPWQVADSGV